MGRMNPRRMEENGAYSSASRSSCSGDRTRTKMGGRKKEPPSAASAPRPPRRPPAPCPPGRTPENTALETAAPQSRPQSTRGRWQGSRAVLPRHIQSTCFSCSSSFTFRSAAGFGRALMGAIIALPAGEENTRAMLTNVKFLWILKLCSMHLLKILSKAAIMRNTNLVMRKRLGCDVSTGGNGTTE